MIRAVSGHGGGEAAFLAAANAWPLPGVELASAWYAFGKGRERGAHGWYFFAAGEDEAPFGLALRGGTAWACGPHDPEELGEFLRCVGASRLTARLAGEGTDPAPACPDGFAPAERMLGFVRPCAGGTGAYAARGAEALLPAGYCLAGEKDAARVAAFLRQEGAFALPAEKLPGAVPGESAPAEPDKAQQNAARLFAQELDARAAAGLGYAALLLEDAAAPQTAAPASPTPAGMASAPPSAPVPGGQPAAGMVVTTAPHARAVCLSALYLRAGLRGQGLGSRMVRVLAAGAGQYARGVCLLCRPGRAGFYARLGFVPEGEYACFVPARPGRPQAAQLPGRF